METPTTQTERTKAKGFLILRGGGGSKKMFTTVLFQNYALSRDSARTGYRLNAFFPRSECGMVYSKGKVQDYRHNVGFH